MLPASAFAVYIAKYQQLESVIYIIYLLLACYLLMVPLHCVWLAAGSEKQVHCLRDRVEKSIEKLFCMIRILGYFQVSPRRCIAFQTGGHRPACEAVLPCSFFERNDGYCMILQSCSKFWLSGSTPKAQHFCQEPDRIGRRLCPWSSDLCKRHSWHSWPAMIRRSTTEPSRISNKKNTGLARHLLHSLHGRNLLHSPFPAAPCMSNSWT